VRGLAGSPLSDREGLSSACGERRQEWPRSRFRPLGLAGCVVRPSWPDTVRAGSPDYVRRWPGLRSRPARVCPDIRSERYTTHHRLGCRCDFSRTDSDAGATEVASTLTGIQIVGNHLIFPSTLRPWPAVRRLKRPWSSFQRLEVEALPQKCVVRSSWPGGVGAGAVRAGSPDYAASHADRCGSGQEDFHVPGWRVRHGR